MRYVAAWFVLAIMTALGLGSINWRFFHQIADRGVVTKGVVLELMPKIHDTIRYEFKAGGNTYAGRSSPWLPNPPVAEMKVGQAVIIYYDPLNPFHSVAGDPKPMLANETITVVLAALTVPILVVAACAKGISRFNAKRRNRAISA